MPIYEYKCSSCQHSFEQLQKHSDPTEQNCPNCNAPVKRLMSKTSFQLKGTGWYQTDYKKPPSQGSQTPESKNEKKDSSQKSTQSTSENSQIKSDTSNKTPTSK